MGASYLGNVVKWKEARMELENLTLHSGSITGPSISLCERVMLPRRATV